MNDLYHWGVKGMKWRKHKKTAAQEAESAARMLEGAVRSAQEEKAKNSKIHQNFYKNIDWSTTHEGNKNVSMDVRKARYNASKRAHDKAVGSELYAENRVTDTKRNDNNRLAIRKYSEKATSKANKAKQFVKGLFSKNNKGGKAVTTYHKRTDAYGQYKTTRYQPKKKKRR